MQPEYFDHFAAGDHYCFLNECSITLICNIFENSSSSWVRRLKQIEDTTVFFPFPRQESSLL